MACFDPSRLTRLRKAKGWSRAEVARQANLDPTHYGRIEAGKRLPSYDVAAALADVLGASLDDFREKSGKSIQSA
jgi:transcriptional regulator with XRE-family HTH domain